METEEYREIAKRVRRQVLQMIYNTKSPHIGGCFSCVDILVSLYFSAMNVSPETKKDEGRDIFILSKGHACPALYAVLAERGFFAKEQLEKFAINGGLLEGHPNQDLDLGIEVSTGSLGYGLSVGAGMALARKLNSSSSKVFVLLSDGDLQEGCVWQALMFSAQHKLNNLRAIIDYNKLQVLGETKDVLNLEPLKDKLEAFGWEVEEVDGHDFNEIIGSLQEGGDKPKAIIAHTKKGKGISFMEDNLAWHSKCPNEEEYNRALIEIK